MTFWSW